MLTMLTRLVQARVHARGDGDRAQVADRSRAVVLQGGGPEHDLEAEEDGEGPAAVRQVR